MMSLALDSLPEFVSRGQISADVLARWGNFRDILAADNDVQDNEIRIYGEIGASDDDPAAVSISRVAAALRKIGAQPLTVSINSPGGSFFHGVGIFNLLAAHPAEVTVRIVGLAASAASVVAMAGNRIEIGRAAQIMIHNSRALAFGDAGLMLQTASVLEKFDADMAALYHERSRKFSAQHFRELMAMETWMGAEEAVAAGLADSIFAPETKLAPVSDLQYSALMSLVAALEGSHAG